MDGLMVDPVSDEEIAEVIGSIDEMLNDPAFLDQGLALCRSVCELTSTPKLALHGVVCLLKTKRKEDLL